MNFSVAISPFPPLGLMRTCAANHSHPLVYYISLQCIHIKMFLSDLEQELTEEENGVYIYAADELI